MSGFSSARDLIRWAREDIEEFDSLSEEFMFNSGYSPFKEVDLEAGEVTYKISLSALPDKFRKLASHALWDIKHAADHATNEAVSQVSRTEIGDVHFPVCTHPNDLKAKLRNPNAKFPPALHALFESFEVYPTGNGYPGGNDEFCRLSKMANTTKHEVSLHVGVNNRIARFQGQGRIGGGRMYPVPIKSGENELTLAHFPWDPDAEINLDLTAFVAFDEPHFSSIPAMAVLGAWSDSVTSVIDQLEAETALLTGRMG